jgi:gamma-glutamylcysteine synthetase
MLTEIPEKWYVLYSSREEFDIINNHFEKDWRYYETIRKNGYTNISHCNNWIGLEGSGSDINDLEKEGVIEISFEDFEKYIIRKEPSTKPKKENLKYLITLFKKLGIK